jgi:hypothetical protein
MQSEIRARRSAARVGIGRSLAVLALAVVALTAFAAAAAAAPIYTVDLCTARNPPSSGSVVTGTSGAPLFASACNKTPEVGEVLLGSSGGTIAAGKSSVMVIDAPGGARFSFLGYTEKVHPTPGSPSFLKWEIGTEGGNFQSYIDDGRGGFTTEATRGYGISAQEIFARVSCVQAVSCTGGAFSASISQIAAELEDLFPPTIPIAPGVPGGPVGGAFDVQFSASDHGSGIAEVGLVVDGQAQSMVKLENGGKCVGPRYLSVTPCIQELQDAELPLDTTQFSDGVHRVAVVAIDATHQSTESPASQFEIRNAPLYTTRPLVRGSAFVGSTLSTDSGRWLGSPKLTYQWLRCPAAIPSDVDPAVCAPISGATESRYQLSGDDLGHRDIVEVVATNGFGKGTATSVAGELVAATPPTSSGGGKGPIHPLISAVKLSRKRFRVGATPGKGRGSVLSFSSTQNGNLTMLIERPKKRHKWARVSKLAAAIKQGRSQVLLSGEFDKGEKLRPGRYRVTLTVRNAVGLASDRVSATFTIKRG